MVIKKWRHKQMVDGVREKERMKGKKTVKKIVEVSFGATRVC